ncbi:hypothetical protein DFP72DRAFT_433148 [Ephemerocybe angulata]|uniref:Nephrocystin 3-like N-terminal domain-containing protein n=1 Tax=Ephemerocybe angulata TaxID=980116 RepID=A0A8H6HTK5_9AGAR|nr:hypothetical protein DFP72DRAFT_433148 [Tulosesus angulatus]
MWLRDLFKRKPKITIVPEESSIGRQSTGSPYLPTRGSGSAAYLSASYQPPKSQAPGSAYPLPPPVDLASVLSWDSLSVASSNQPPPSNTPPPLSERNSRQSFFTNASHFHVESVVYNHVAGQKRQGTIGWEKLAHKTTANALHDSSARFDPPKCDEDTRVELIRQITTWIKDRRSPARLLCMTGAAGSGKSALQQTIAEGCEANNILAASFFFNTADTTRNNTSMVIPTIAYQIGTKSDALRRMIGIVVEDNPLIFKQALKTQIEKLILDPVARLPRSERKTIPHAILIDGLDECNEERDQRELLHAIHDILHKRRSPFRIFLASRPEQAIFEALAPGGYLRTKKVYHIRLSDGDYDASSDIRHTVRKNFEKIGEQRGWGNAWFTEEDVNSIVDAASGQYIYAATAIRYISDPRRSPVTRLREMRSIQSGTPPDGNNPLAPLDSLYSLVLTAASEVYERMETNVNHEYLLILRVYLAINAINLNLDIERQDQLLGLGEGMSNSILCDLRSILIPHSTDSHGGKTTQLKVYHKSFLDFLNAPERAGALYIPKVRCAKYITESCLRRIDSYSLEDIRDGNTLSDEEFKLRYKEKELDLLDCAMLLCAVLWRKDSPFAGDAPKDDIVTMLLQFGASGFEKIHAWVTHPVMHFVGAPPWIENTYPQYEFVERWEKCMEPVLAKEFEKRDPDLAKILKKYTREWVARKADMVAGRKGLRVVEISGRSSGERRRDCP